MGNENLKPLDELKKLDQQIDRVDDLAGLKPIFFRLEEIAKANVNDFDVQLAVGDIKQHLVNRGTKLKEMRPGATTPVPVPVPPQPSPAPPPIASTPAPQPPSAPPIPPVPPMAPPPAAPAPPQAAPLPPQPPMPQPTAFMPPSGYAPPPSTPSTPPTGTPPTGTPPSAPPPMPTAAIPIAPPPGGPSQGMPPQGPWATTENKAPTPPPVIGAPVGGVPPSSPGTDTKRTAIPPKPMPATTESKPASKQGANWQRPVIIGVLVGVLLVAAIAAGVVVHKRRQQAAATAAIAVQISTNPPGASIKVNDEMQCTSNCSVSLAPGNYQITAFLDGYEPAASGITVGPGQPTTLNLALDPQAQSLRIITDLDQGKVALDGDPPADLQEGQYVLDRLLPGSHTVKVTGRTGEASFSFTVTDAKQPAINGAVTARNLDAVVVASMANQAHVVTSQGPMKLAVNGNAEADTNPAGVDLKNFQAGVDELVLGEGKDQHSVKENFGPAPMLTAFLKSDLNAGTLVVSTGEDDVRVFINNKEYPRHTQRGSIRIQTLGPVLVRVAKDGFDSPPVQSAEVKKGSETRLEFKLTQTPRFATLQISGGTPGAIVMVDQRNGGTVGADGALINSSIPPGDHTIDITRDGYTPRRLTRSFKAGQTVTLQGGDAQLAATPAPAPQVAKVEPPPPAPKKEAAPPPQPQAGTMADWEDPSAWKMEGGVWLHKGAGFIPYKLPPKGEFAFTVQLVKGGGFLHSAHIRWALNYKDAKNYALYEMDNKNFWAKVVNNGKQFERTHTQLKDLEKQKSFTIQIDVTPEHVVHKMFSGGDWVNLDSWAETGRDFSEGKFGFLLQGSEEISLSDFKFQPK